MGEVEREVEQDGDTEAPARLERQAIAGPASAANNTSNGPPARWAAPNSRLATRGDLPRACFGLPPLLDASPEQRSSATQVNSRLLNANSHHQWGRIARV